MWPCGSDAPIGSDSTGASRRTGRKVLFAGDNFRHDLNQMEGSFGILFGCVAKVGCIFQLHDIVAKRRFAMMAPGFLRGASAGARQLRLITLSFDRVGPKLVRVVCLQLTWYGWLRRQIL